MYGRHACYSSLIDAFHRPNPQFKVGVYGVLNEHDSVSSPQTVGESLHRKRVCRSAGTHPKDVDAVFQCQLHMLRCRHFCRYKHSGLLLDALQPRQCLFAVTLESARFCAWFPHSCTVNPASARCQLVSGGDDLLFGFSRTRTGNDKRPLLVARQIKWL